MRTRLFALIMVALCAVAVAVCVPQALRLKRARDRRVTYRRAFDLYRSQSYEEALALLDECLAFRPDDLALYKMGANIARELEDPQLADQYYQGLLERADDELAADLHFQLGALALREFEGREPDPQKAIEHLAKAVELNEDAVDAHAALGIALAQEGDFERARPHLDVAARAAASGGATSDLARTASLWRLLDHYRSGEPLEVWLESRRLPHAGRANYIAPLRLALAFRANAPGLSSAVRRECIQAAKAVLRDPGIASAHGVLLHTMMAEAHDHLGEDDQALKEYEAAHKLQPGSQLTRRNLARAYFLAAQRTRGENRTQELRQKSAKLYRDLLADQQLDPQQHRQVVLALASHAWKQGRRDDAARVLEAASDVQSPLLERMRATQAMESGDYKGATEHLGRALELDPQQPDAKALLERLSRKPLIRNLRVNRLDPHDPRPIIAATILPQAVAEPIPPDNVEMRIDGKAVPPREIVVTRAECFYRPAMADRLKPGEHRVELTVTDTLGHKASDTLTFKVAWDTEGPAVVGAVPPPGSDTATLEPQISFVCTDPSGIDVTSLKVDFRGRVGKPPRERQVTIIDKGLYAVDFERAGVRKGQPVEAGAVQFQFSWPLGEGKCAVRVSVEDKAGNRSTREWWFRVTPR
ncbi:MAG: tetratricopeptide repeat protein [Candidatus Brocadiia bacterium]